LAYTLNEEAKLRYSLSERLVFQIIGRKPLPVSSSAVVAQYYKAKDVEPPYNCRPIVMGALRSLVRKVEINKEPFTIKRIKHQGNKVLEYQLVDRP
jgi:hypothetical protein